MLAQSAAKNLVRDMIATMGTTYMWPTEAITQNIAANLDVTPEDVLPSDITRVRELLDHATVVVRFPNTRTRRTHR